MARSTRKPASKRKRGAARAPATEAPARSDARDLLEGVGPVRWGDTEGRLARDLGLTRSTMMGWHLVPRPWVLPSGEPMVIELKFHPSTGRIEALRAAWHGDEEGGFDAWFSGEAPRRFEALLASMGCVLTGHARYQCDPAKAGDVATLGEGDGDEYRGPGDVVVRTSLDFDPPEFALHFAPPAPPLEDVAVLRAVAAAKRAVRAVEPDPDADVEAALERLGGLPDAATWGEAEAAMRARARLDASATSALAYAVGAALAVRAAPDARRRADVVALREALRAVFVRCGEGDDAADAQARALLPTA